MDVGVVPWRTNRVLAKCVGECYSAIGGHELVCVRGVHVEALISGPLLEFGSQVINHDPQYMAVWFAEFLELPCGSAVTQATAATARTTALIGPWLMLLGWPGLLFGCA